MPVELKRGLEVPEQASPGTPGSGKRLLYPKSDGKWYTKDSTGVETAVSSSGGAGSGTQLANAQISASSNIAGTYTPGATEGAGTLTAMPSNIGADAVSVGMRILLRAQSDQRTNGLWKVDTVGTGANGVWSRPTDFRTGVLSNTWLLVQSGDDADTAWTLASDSVTIDGGSASFLVWRKFSAGVVPVQAAPPSGPVTGQVYYDSDESATPWSEFPDLRLTTDYTNTTPAAPASGLRFFTRHRARRLPAVIGAAGQDTQLQPAIFTNRIARINTVNNVATPQYDGIAVTNIAAPTAVAVATSSFYAAMAKHRFTSVATAGNQCGFRSANAQWFASATANMGGVFMVCRFGLNAITATNRIFIGFSTTTGALAAATNPSAFLNMFGFAADSTHTTFRFMNNDGAGTATAVDLGANFPAQTAATYFYEFRIFVPSGVGNQVYWSAHRLNDGAFVQGGPITTDLPAVGSLLAFHFHHSNGTTATAVASDLQSLYVETDN